MKCNQCNSFAQHLINIYSKNALELYWDCEKNKNINPWKISKSSEISVYIKCQNKKYHGSYKIRCSSFTRGDRCSYCQNFKIHKLDSLGYLYPESLDVWSDKNKKTPFEFAPKSHTKVWWKCPDEKHKDFKRSIKVSNILDFRCSLCSFSKGEKCIEDYLINNLFIQNVDYIPQKEFDGLIGLGEGNLSYDFYLPKYNILIEYQGEQHEKYIKGFHKSKKDFEKQKEHDRRKKQYAKDNNIKLLEIWYWDFDNIEKILEKELNINNKKQLKNVI